MSHKNMHINEVAAMLGMDFHDLTRMARKGELPCRSVRGRFQFNTTEICTWLAQSVPDLGQPRLTELDTGLNLHRQGTYPTSMLTALLDHRALHPALDARTHASLHRKVVSLATATDKLYDEHALLASLTCLPISGNAALLYPRRALPYALGDSIVAIACTRGPIRFDRETSPSVFALCASPDEIEQAHLLTRVARLLKQQDLIDALQQAQSPLEIRNLILEAEADTLTVMV